MENKITGVYGPKKRLGPKGSMCFCAVPRVPRRSGLPWLPQGHGDIKTPKITRPIAGITTYMYLCRKGEVDKLILVGRSFLFYQNSISLPYVFSISLPEFQTKNRIY